MNAFMKRFTFDPSLKSLTALDWVLLCMVIPDGCHVVSVEGSTVRWVRREVVR